MERMNSYYWQTYYVTHNTERDITLARLDDDNPHTRYIITSTPIHGTIRGFDEFECKLTYTPDKDFKGTDYFMFMSEISQEEPAVVRIMVRPPGTLVYTP